MPEEKKTEITDKKSAVTYLESMVSSQDATAADCIEALIIGQQTLGRAEGYEAAENGLREKISRMKYKPVEIAKATLKKKGYGLAQIESVLITKLSLSQKNQAFNICAKIFNREAITIDMLLSEKFRFTHEGQEQTTHEVQEQNVMESLFS